MSRATSDALDAIHGLLAGALADELKAAIDLSKHDDEDKRQPINPQLLDKAMKFLKDNAITAPANNKPLHDLASTLGDLDLDNEAMRVAGHA
jgi:hypothetical protein